MSKDSQTSSTGTPGPARTLTERVQARIADARRTLDDGEGNSNASHKHVRPTRLAARAGSLAGDSESRREVQRLQWVYCEMRMTYRRYRRETRRPAIPELRNAVLAFRRGPSLTSLVDVATFLDDRQLLAW